MFGGPPKSMQEACHRPLRIMEPTYSSSVLKAPSYYCSQFRLLAVPMHITHSTVVEKYKVSEAKDTIPVLIFPRND